MCDTYKLAVDSITELCKSFAVMKNRTEDEIILQKFRDMTHGVVEVAAQDKECKMEEFIVLRNYWKEKHEELRDYLQNL